MGPLSVAPISAPALLQLGSLSDEEESTRLRLITQLRRAQKANARQQDYYEGARQVRDLGIAIPPHLTVIESVIAWPEIVVDVLSERLQWRGWSSETDLGLSKVYDENRLRVETGQSTLASLICGVGFMVVGTGAEGEPDVLVTPASPNRMTGTWNARTRRLSDALAETYDERGMVSGWQIYEPNQTIRLERKDGRVVVADRDKHKRNRVPVAVLRNRPTPDRPDGRSEITRAVRSLTDNGMRTILGMEVSREFYGAPQRALMGADESMFVDEDGNKVSQWAAVIGKMLMVPRDEEGNLPSATTFQAASPQPYTDILRTLTQLMSSTTGVPAHHLGFTTDNPASAEAIAGAEVRLNKKAIDRQEQYDLGLIELGELAYLWREGELPATPVSSLWVNPATVSPGAAADRAVKMIAAGVLDPTWDFTLEQFGLSDDEIKRVQSERRRGSGTAALRAITQAAAAGRPAVTLPTQPVTDAANPPA